LPNSHDAVSDRWPHARGMVHVIRKVGRSRGDPDHRAKRRFQLRQDRCLQAILPRPWIRMGVDDLIDALPPGLMDDGSGIGFGTQGEVTIGDGFREIEAA